MLFFSPIFWWGDWGTLKASCWDQGKTAFFFDKCLLFVPFTLLPIWHEKPVLRPALELPTLFDLCQLDGSKVITGDHYLLSFDCDSLGVTNHPNLSETFQICHGNPTTLESSPSSESRPRPLVTPLAMILREAGHLFWCPRGWDDPLEKDMATRSSILAWTIPWTEEPGGLSPCVAKSQTRPSDSH